MEEKKVQFNIETAKCGLCAQDDFSEVVAIGTAEAYCKTCQKFLCAECLKSHRRLVVSEGHKILNRDHIIKGKLDKPNKKSPAVVAQYHDFNQNKVFNGLHENQVTNHSVITAESEAIYKGVLEDVDHVDYGSRAIKSGENRDKHVNVAKDQAKDEENEVDFTEVCNVHDDHFIKYYCEHHKQLICDVCKINNHKICGPFVKYIPDVTQDFDNATVPLENDISDLKEHDRKLQSDLKELKKSKSNFLYDLSVKKKEIMDWLNLMEVKAVNQMEGVVEKCKHDIEQQRHYLKEARHELSAELFFLKAILQNESHDRTYKFIKTKQAEKSSEKVKSKKDRRPMSKTRFEMNINDEFDATRQNVSELYRLKFQSKGETKFNVRLTDDKYVSDITGCTVMPDGSVVLADNRNACVKIFSLLMKPIASISIQDGVFDVTSISANCLGVTCPIKSRIYVIERETEMKIVKEVYTGKGQCFGLKFNKNRFAVNCFFDDAFCIRVVDLDSQILFQVKTRDSMFSELCFDDSTSVLTVLVASSYGEYTKTETEVNYVDIRKQKKQDDVVVMEYNYLNHLHTRGVALDRHGNLVVCCKDSHQIYTISRTGQEVELMLAEVDGLDSPQAISYTANKAKLLVTSENTNFIQIFEFDI